jgi:endonuclease-8
VSEGDTIHRIAAELRSSLVGRRVVSSSIAYGERTLVPAGTLVREVVARGKHLLIRFDVDRVLHTHLGMHGVWRILPPGARNGRVPPRVAIEVLGARAVCIAAPVVEVLPERALSVHPVLTALGPDLCDPEPDLDEVVARFARLVEPGAEIAPTLLDQRIASGIGNVYKSEVLFAERLDPFTRTDARSSDRARALYGTASRLLRANLGAGRRRTVPGGYAVYGRAGRSCRRCGGEIRSDKQDGRTTCGVRAVR